MPAIQVKSVPDDMHDALRQRAAERGVTLGDYLLELIRRDLARPRWAEWAEHHPPLDAASPGVAAHLAGALAAARHDRDTAPDEGARP